MKSRIKYRVVNITPVLKSTHSLLTSTFRNNHSLFEVFIIQSFITFLLLLYFRHFFGLKIQITSQDKIKGEKYQQEEREQTSVLCNKKASLKN